MSELQAQLNEWRAALLARVPAAPAWVGGRWQRPAIVLLLAFLIVFPLLFAPASGFLQATIIAFAYVVMALGLNIVIGFAGLLDLGYVAFYALGAYCVGWFGSDFLSAEHASLLSSAAHDPIGTSWV